MKAPTILLVLFCLLGGGAENLPSVSTYGTSELVVNVGILGPGTTTITNVHQQTIKGNSSTDTVVIEYAETDGTIVTQLTDFRMQSQITRVILAGEEELGEPSYHVVCFVSTYTGDLIPPEAVMKLRQKHPSAIRVAEEDRGHVVQDSALILKAAAASRISSHLTSLCREALVGSVFTSSHELHEIMTVASGMHNEENTLNEIADEFPEYESLPLCSNLNSQSDDEAKQPCHCTRPVRLDWYPSALKYCRNKDGEGEHRCGIKSSRKSISFGYPVRDVNMCPWDDIP